MNRPTQTSTGRPGPVFRARADRRRAYGSSLCAFSQVTGLTAR